MDYEKKQEIPFGAFDSELIEETYFIPEGMEAVIEGDKVIIRRKESEDDRIRKELIQLISCMHDADHRKKDWLAWIEKQGEQKSFDYENANIQQKDFASIDPQFYKQEQKFEPKFKVGDWVLNNVCLPVQIALIKDGMYIFTDGDALSVSFVDETYHLWTLDDANPGDVLYINNTVSESIMIYKSFNNGLIKKYASYNKFGFEGEHYLTLNDGYITPATKEQRDTLFAKMKEAGYEWDAEKKELKKVDAELTDFEKSLKHIMIETLECGDTHNLKADADMLLRLIQNPTWSEEDEKMFRNLNSLIYVVRDSDCGSKEKLKLSVWLKSLKDKYTWKPSDEQMKQLGWIVEQNKDNMIGKELISLYQDLKKLMKD